MPGLLQHLLAVQYSQYVQACKHVGEVGKAGTSTGPVAAYQLRGACYMMLHYPQTPGPAAAAQLPAKASGLHMAHFGPLGIRLLFPTLARSMGMQTASGADAPQIRWSHGR